MTALEAVKKSLKQFGFPCLPYRYEGNEPRYITYNYAMDQGADFGDDAPGCDLVSVQVHFFMPIKGETGSHESYVPMKKRIRRTLFENDFTYPTVTVIEEQETNTWHLIFECEYTEDE